MAVVLRSIVALRKGHQNYFFRLSTAVTVRKGPDASNKQVLFKFVANVLAIKYRFTSMAAGTGV
jgi:hypothetical protein